jgi:predicted small lipoprotein YifL
MVGQILVRTLALVPLMATLLVGCGQKGGLYLPQEPEAQQRATLPQILTPSLPGTSPDKTPASAPSSR